VDPLIDPETAEGGGEALVAVVRDDATARHTAEHSHARGQLIGAMRGLMTLRTETGQWVVPAVHAVWAPPHVVHGLHSHGPYAGFSVYIAQARCGDLPAEPRTLRVSGLLREAVLRAATWRGGPLDAARMRIADVIIAEIAASPREALGLPMPRDRRLVGIAEALASDPADKRSLEGWAALGGLSKRNLTRLFRTETGHSLAQWRQQARLMRALEKLAAGDAVTTIAFDLGYETVSAFIAAFRRGFGVTPGQYSSDENIVAPQR
jgi:AraC-like DNA-binding protein